MDIASLRAFTATAAAAGQSISPATVLLAGVEYSATVPTPRVTGVLGKGLTIDDGELVCRILLIDLPARPLENQPLKWKRPDETEWNAIPWWVETVSRAEMDVEWKLVCRPKN